METVLLTLQLALALVFAVAGFGKVRDPAGSRQALTDFGAPAGAVAALALLLPAAEVAIATALVFQPSARVAGAGAALLLVIFSGAIAAAMARGRAPDCHCFGQIHSAPAGGAALARNAVLALAATLVAVRGPAPSVTDWIAERSAGELAFAGIIVVIAAAAGVAASRWSVARAERRWEEEQRRPAGLPVGSVAPGFDLQDLAGRRRSLADLRARERPVVLLFTHPGCGPCADLIPDVGRWQATLADRLTIAVVSQSDRDSNRVVAEASSLENVLVEEESETFDTYGMRGTPSAVVVSSEGLIASVTAEHGLAIEHLIRMALADRSATPALASADR